MITRRRTALLLAAGAVMAAGVLLYQWRVAASRAARLAQGEQMYRRGLLPTGKPMAAVVRGDVTVDGVMVTCVNCHLASGFGAAEGQLVAPPVDGESLFHPVKLLYKGVEVAGAAPRRPAYSPQTLAQVIRTGVDPTGRTLNEAMPRYELADPDAEVLIEYLASLSAQPSPGVTEGTITLATVMTDEVPAAEREAMLFALEKYVALKNGQARHVRRASTTARRE